MNLNNTLEFQQLYQFLLDEDTQKLLVICSPSALYRWLRMPFGPSPAPAHMQSYVAKTFGSLRDKKGGGVCQPIDG